MMHPEKAASARRRGRCGVSGAAILWILAAALLGCGGGSSDDPPENRPGVEVGEGQGRGDVSASEIPSEPQGPVGLQGTESNADLPGLSNAQSEAHVVAEDAADEDAVEPPSPLIGLEPKVRAAMLSLGSHRAGAELIRGRPREQWLEAAKALAVELPEKPLCWPIEGGRFGRGLSWRGRRIKHRGVDISADIGTPVHALADGLVGYVNDTIQGYGQLVIVLHGDGSVSSYAHLSAFRVQVGAVVRRGQVIALTGNTGRSRGPHLHFEWRENGREADPIPHFPREVLPRWLQRLHFPEEQPDQVQLDVAIRGRESEPPAPDPQSEP